MKMSLRILSLVTLFALSACSASSESAVSESEVGQASFALTNSDILGFESVTGWSTTKGLLSSSSSRVQGAASLAVTGVAGNAQLKSKPLSTLSSVSSTLSLRIQLPSSQPNPYWYGNVQLAVNAPSRGINSAFIGQKDLTGLPLGSFQKLDFTVPSAVVSALGSGSYSDLQFVLTLNFPSSGTYLLDDLSFGGGTSSLGTNTRKVHVVYLRPSDKAVQPAYVSNLQTAARHLQGFFSGQLAGKTFTLTDPIVTVLQSTHDSAWFGVGSFHYNIVNEASALTGVDVLNDPNDRWLVYADVLSPCNNGTGATGSVASFPASDFLGLTQQPIFSSCTGELEYAWGRCRWVGGMGHELGHILGLPHPPGCESSIPGTACPTQALMWTGYTSYTNTFFTQSDLVTLNSSPQLQLENIASFPTDCSTVTN